MRVRNANPLVLVLNPPGMTLGSYVIGGVSSTQLLIATKRCYKSRTPTTSCWVTCYRSFFLFDTFNRSLASIGHLGFYHQSHQCSEQGNGDPTPNREKKRKNKLLINFCERREAVTLRSPNPQCTPRHWARSTPKCDTSMVIHPKAEIHVMGTHKNHRDTRQRLLINPQGLGHLHQATHV